MEGTLYQDSQGTYWSDVQVWEQFEADRWNPCCWDSESGQEWVETVDGELLALTPVAPADLPDDVQFSVVEEGLLVHDERRQSTSASLNASD